MLPLAYWQLFNKNLLLKMGGLIRIKNNRELDFAVGFNSFNWLQKNFPKRTLLLTSSLARTLFSVNQESKTGRQSFGLKKAEKFKSNPDDFLVPCTILLDSTL